MKRALAPSVALGVLLAGAAMAGRRTPADDPDAVRARLATTERDRAADLAAQKEAAARAARAAETEQRLAAERVEAAAKLREAELATEAVTRRLDELVARREAAAARLAARADDLAPLLPLIERLSLYPSETLLAVPQPADDALRGVLVLQGLGAELEAEAAALRTEQSEVADLSRAVEAERPALREAETAQQARAADLDRRIAATRGERAEAEEAAAEAARRAAAEAARADNLRGVIATVEAARVAAESRAQAEAGRADRARRATEADEARRRQLALAEPGGAATLPPSAEPRGQFTAPVPGTVVHGWGEATAAGPASGVSYQAPPGARVLAPCAGRTMFAAPFRSYGLLVILDCGGGYHVVLAGMDKLDAQVGARLAAGEPVGTMGAWDPARGGPRPTLYMELRHDGQPVNPAPWLRARG
jgi:septal ring factor EnvC (AmiA/AmiB activator)